MEIRIQPPPEYGEKLLYKEIQSTLDLKNPLIEEILSTLKEKGFLPTEDEKYGAQLCLDEVIVNAIRHGNNEDSSKIVKVSLYVGEQLWAIRIEDEGDGFTPEENVPDVEDEDSWELERGRGVTIMEHYMDEIWYYNNGASVQLKKKMSESFFKKMCSSFHKAIEKILSYIGIR